MDPFAYACEPLAPLQRPRDLEFYYDFYQWVDQEALGTLGPDGRISSWQIGNQGRMTTLLISGAQGCGRSSLKNLLLYEMAERWTPRPIVVEYSVSPSASRPQSALSLARVLDREAKLAAPALGTTASDTIETWRNDLLPGTDPDLDSLFSQLKYDIGRVLPSSPIVVSLDALTHQVSRDTAHATATMVQQLADFVILSLTDLNDARTIRSRCRDAGQPVALVAAPKMGLAKATLFVAQQLDRQRANPQQPPIYPFTDEALKTLFEPTVHKGAPIDLPLGVAIKRLAGAMSLRCDPANGGPGPITATDMRAVMRT